MLKKDKNEELSYVPGILEPQNTPALIVAVAFKLSEFGRLSGKSPNQLFGPMGIALPEHVLDSWDFLNIEQYADIPVSRVQVKKDFLEKQKINVIDGGKNGRK
tara:strand:+ start:41 stop:349 length:309 start_codon:yes stop_codon:yes gene_type:complete